MHVLREVGVQPPEGREAAAGDPETKTKKNEVREYEMFSFLSKQYVFEMYKSGCCFSLKAMSWSDFLVEF